MNVQTKRPATLRAPVANKGHALHGLCTLKDRFHNEKPAGHLRCLIAARALFTGSAFCLWIWGSLRIVRGAFLRQLIAFQLFKPQADQLGRRLGAR